MATVSLSSARAYSSSHPSHSSHLAHSSPSARRGAPTGTSLHHVYLVRRVAVALAAILMAVVLVSLLSTRFADATGPAGSSGSTARVGSFVVAQPGDTLWSLARKVQPDGDVRPLVAQLSRAHGGSALRAGDRVAIPGALTASFSVSAAS